MSPKCEYWLRFMLDRLGEGTIFDHRENSTNR